mmetsp:Transcript_47069/g.140487  ORF Transcript_47069/g.140487 Transcript_47069/m.140487 type:complete len:257 (+) Transcript_47069:66-836(+)
MVVLSLGTLKAVENLEEFCGLKHPKPPLVPSTDLLHANDYEQHKVQAALSEVTKALPTVSECLEVVQLTRASLSSHLEDTSRSLIEANQPNASRVLQTVDMLEDALDQAAFVFMGFVLGSHQLESRVLPGLRSAVGRMKRTSAVNLVGVAQNILAEMRRSVEDLQVSYLRLVDEVIGLQNSVVEAQVKPASKCLLFGLAPLLQELQACFAGLEVGAQRLRGELLRCSRGTGLPLEYTALCKALDELSVRFSAGGRS